MKPKPNRWMFFFWATMLAGLVCAIWMVQELSALPSAAAATEAMTSVVQEQSALESEASALLAKARTSGGATQKTTASAVRQRPAGAATPLNGQMLRVQQGLNDPAFLHNLALVQKSDLDETYGPMFKQLNLSPADLERLNDLLVEKKMAKLDSVIAAAQQGMSYGQYVQAAGEPPDGLDDQVKSLLGSDGDQLFKRYQGTLNTRLVVEDLKANLAAAGAPLTGEQTENLIAAWAAATPADQQLKIYGGGPVESAVLTDAGIFPRNWDPDLLPNNASALALNLLTPQQMAVIQEAEQAKQAGAEWLQLAGTIPPIPSSQQRRSPPRGN